jgi:hypothetical protein
MGMFPDPGVAIASFGLYEELSDDLPDGGLDLCVWAVCPPNDFRRRVSIRAEDEMQRRLGRRDICLEIVAGSILEPLFMIQP